MEHLTLKEIEESRKHLGDYAGLNSPAPLYHEQEYPLREALTFGHRIEYWEAKTLLIARRARNGTANTSS